MQFLTKSFLAAMLTEGFFAVCLRFGKAIDVDSGDILGLVGWLAHLPFAMLLKYGSHVNLYSDVFSWPLMLAGLACWSVFWAAHFSILTRLRSARFQPTHAIERPRNA